MASKLLILLTIFLIIQPASESFLITALATYGLCQTACNAAVVICYSAAGFTFGTVTAGVGVPAAIVVCNTALAACMAKCVAVAAASAALPTP